MEGKKHKIPCCNYTRLRLKNSENELEKPKGKLRKTYFWHFKAKILLITKIQKNAIIINPNISPILFYKLVVFIFYF